jgi:hypothetical protein
MSPEAPSKRTALPGQTRQMRKIQDALEEIERTPVRKYVINRDQWIREEL